MIEDNVKSNNEDKHNAHDKFFKKYMSLPAVHIDFFQKNLPSDIKKLLNWDSIKLYTTEFVSEDNKTRSNDLVFEAALGDEPGFFIVFTEHQTKPERLMSLRIIEYTLLLAQHYLDTHEGSKKFPLIYPMVIYQGKAVYPYSNDIRDLVLGPRELIDNYFLKPFVLIDLPKADEKQWLDNLSYSNFMKLIMKFVRQVEHFKFEEILTIIELTDIDGNERAVEIAVNYILRCVPEEKKKALRAVIEELPNTLGGDMFISLADSFRAEGKLEGRAEGRAEGKLEGELQKTREFIIGMLREKFDLQTIRKVTEASIADIKEIEREVFH